MSTSPTSGAENHSQTRRVTMSGWAGSVLEYYDFFIYATAAALIFPQIFFPKSDPATAIIVSLATYGVGYVARPIGALVLGHIGDTRGRKTVLVLCMLLMGFSTVGVGLLPTYDQIGIWAPCLLLVLRLLQGFAVAGEVSGASSMILEYAPEGQRGYYSSFTLQGVQAGQILAAAVFLPLAHYMSDEAFTNWGWRIPFLLSFFVILVAYNVRRKVSETPIFQQTEKSGVKASAPLVEAVRNSWANMLRVWCMTLINVIAVVATVFGAAYAVQPAYGIGFSKDVYLWIPVVGNILAVLVIPWAGKLSDRIGRRPPMMFAAISTGLLAFLYLYAISIHNVWLAIATSLFMWGIVYQGYNAVFPSFYAEMFPARNRVSAMAVAQNLGVTTTALLPMLFAYVAPPGTANIPMIVGSITFLCTLIAAISAWSARETYRVPMSELGLKDKDLRPSKTGNISAVEGNHAV